MLFRVLIFLFLFGCKSEPKIKNKQAGENKVEINLTKEALYKLDSSESWGNSPLLIANKLKTYSKRLNAIDKLPEPEQDIEYPKLNSQIKEGIKKLLQTDSINSIDFYSLFKFSDIHISQSSDKKFITLDWFTNNGGTFHIYSYYRVALLNDKSFIQFKEEAIPPKEIYKLKHNTKNIYLVISKGRTCNTCVDFVAETYLVDSEKGIIPYNCFADSTNFLTLATRLQEKLIFNFDTAEQELLVAYIIDDLKANFKNELGDRIRKVYFFNGENFKLKK